MAELEIKGGIELTEQLFLTLFNTMSPAGKVGCASMLANRLVAGDLADKTLDAAARILVKEMKLEPEALKAFKESVKAKAIDLFQPAKINPQKLESLLQQCLVEVVKDVAKEQADGWFKQLKPAELKTLKAELMPVIAEEIRNIARVFYTRGPGVQTLSALVTEAIQDGLNDVRSIVYDELAAATRAVASQHAQKAGRMGMLSPNGQ